MDEAAPVVQYSFSLDNTRDMFTPSGASKTRLTPAELFDKQAALDRIRLDVYNKILVTVHNKIKMIASLHNSPQMTFFDVPEWMPGSPRYDLQDCIYYIVWNLRHSDFVVVYVPRGRLMISWKHQSEKYYSEESPIRQAMESVANAMAKEQPTKIEKPEKKKPAYKPSEVSGSGGGAKSITFI